MTAPTADQMRALAELADDAAAICRPIYNRKVAGTLRAAANEVDRLRSALDESNTAYIRRVVESGERDVDMNAALARLAKLRLLIENAPHAHLCVSRSGLPCNCWKVDAL